MKLNNLFSLLIIVTLATSAQARTILGTKEVIQKAESELYFLSTTTKVDGTADHYKQLIHDYLYEDLHVKNTEGNLFI